MRQRARRYNGSRGGCRDKVADREEGGTGEAAAETRSASTAGAGECEISWARPGMIYRFIYGVAMKRYLLHALRCNARLKLSINR